MSWGSAAAENAKYMDSIQGRVADFKSAFESLALNLISSDFIKNVVSFGTALLKFANTDLGQATIKILAFIATLKLLKGVGKLIGGSDGFSKMSKIITTFVKTVKGGAGATQIQNLGLAFKGLGANIMKAIGPMNAAIALITLLGGLAYKTIDDAYHKNDRVIDEQKTKVAELETGLEGLRSEYEALSESDSLSAKDQQRLKYLEAQIKLNEILLQQEAKKQYKAQFETPDVKQTAYGRGKVDNGGPIYGETGADKLQKYADDALELQEALRKTQTEIANLDTGAADFEERMAELTKTEQEQKDALSDLQEEYGGTAQEYYELLQKMDPSDISEAQQKLTDDLLKATEGFFDVMGAAEGAAEQATAAGKAFLEVDGYVEGASEALNAYHKALEEGSSDKYFQDYAAAWKTLMDEIKNGTPNSREALESGKLFFGMDRLREAGYHVETLVNQAKYLPTIFNNAESSGAGLIKVLEQMTDSSGNIVSSTGEIIGHLEKLSNGRISLDLPNENFGKLADTLTLDEEGLIAVLNAMTQFGDFSLIDVDEMIDSLQKLGKVAEVSGKKAISLDEYNKQTKNFGNDITKFAQFDQQLAQAGVTVIDFSGNLDKTLVSLKNFGIAKEEAGGKFDVDYSGLKNFMIQLGYSEDEANNFASKLREVDNVSLSNVNGQLDTASSKLSQLANLKITKPFSLVSQLGETAANQIKPVNNTENALKDLNKVSTNKTVGQINNIQTASNRAKQAASQLKTELNSFPKSIPVNITVNGTNMSGGISSSSGGSSSGKSKFGGPMSFVSDYQNNRGKKGGSISPITRQAKGTPNFKGGTALVGDEASPDGSPRPETVIYQGKAQLVGENGPELMDLPKGTQILPYDVTKKFLEGNKVFSGTIPAFAQGIFKQSTVDNLTGGSSSSGSKKKSTSSSSKSTKSSGSKAGAIKEENEALEKQKELYAEEIEILEHQLFLRQKNGASEAEQEELMRNIQKRLSEQAKWYRSQGEDENSEYIRELQKQWWQYADDIKDLQEEVYDKMADAIDDEISIAEDKADLLKRQDRNTAIERIALFKDMQAKVHAQAEKYRAMGLDENSEYIRELKKQWWSLQDEIEDVYDEIQDMVQERADKTETAINWLLKQVNRQIETWKKRQEEIKKKYQDEIDKLREQNELMERQEELQNALNSLAQAQNRKNLIYKDGFFQYLGDVDAVSEAADALKQVVDRQSLDQQIKDLENFNDKEYNELQKNIDNYQKYLDDYEDFVDKYQEAQDKMIAEQIFGFKLHDDNWKELLDNLGDYVQQYNDLMDSINTGSFKDDIADTIYPENKTVAVGRGGTAPKGLNIGDKVVTQGGTYVITDKNADGSYQSTLYDKNWTLPDYVPRSTDNNFVLVDRNGNWKYPGDDEWNSPGSSGGGNSGSSGGNTGGGYKDRPIYGPGDDGSGHISNYGTGQTYAVKVGGGAPKGLGIGDKIATEGGTFQITGFNPDGSYKSRKIDDRRYSGTLRSTDGNPIVVPGYLGGTKGAVGGLSMVGEQGPELRVLNSGDGIIPAKLTDNLMAWGTLNPSAFFSMADKNRGTTQNVNIETVNLPNVSDAEQFVNELKNFTTRAIQYGSA